jgi:hypothetical protein
MRRAISFVLGLFLAAFEGAALFMARDASAAATANVSVTILASNPVVSVLDTVPVAINTATGSVLIHIGSTWLQVPKGADLFAVSSAAAVNAAALNVRDGEGTLRSGMTVSVSASPTAAGPAGLNASTAPDNVIVLVEFN